METNPNRLVRGLLISAGTFCVGVGIIGIFLPVLPTTPFLLLAAALYAKGSKRFYDSLMANRWFGDYIRNYREGRGISLRAKVVAISFLWATILFSALFVVQMLMVQILLMIIAIAVSAHILSIRTKRNL